MSGYDPHPPDSFGARPWHRGDRDIYQRVLLAFDGTVQGRTALREGALLAKRCEANVFLLSVVAENSGVRMAESVYAGVITQERDSYQQILNEGDRQLRELGFSPATMLEFGEPAPTIARFASQVQADLVVVGHRQRGFLERWWSGSTGAYLLDHLDCSLLIARQNEGADAAKTAVDG